MDETKLDEINPDHYKAPNGLEVIEVIEAFGLGYNLGNAVKYILRHKKKGGKTDLEKAIWYLGREIKGKKEDCKISYEIDEFEIEEFGGALEEFYDPAVPEHVLKGRTE